MIGRTISHYRIVERTGEGGMGEVYRAEDTSLERPVALKFLPEELYVDPIARKRFLREARSAAALDHPYICNVFEVASTNDGTDFIVMEYVEGETLQARLEQGPLSLKETLKLGSELAEALESAHEKGIVHRDLKPSNIMLTPAGHAKVMDFGLAKRLVAEGSDTQDLSSALTGTGAVLGTLPYMSPEHIRGQAVDHRSDIFSLGIVLYEAVTGVHPFRKSQPGETAGSILKEEPPPLSRYVAEVPGLLRHTVEKMLAKDPTERFQSVHEVLTNLNRLREDSGKLATVDGEQSRRMPTRAWLLVLFAVFVVAVVVTAISSWLFLSRPPGKLSQTITGMGSLVRSQMELPPQTQLSGGWPVTGFPIPPIPTRREVVISPAGDQVIFSATTQSGSHDSWLFRRALDADHSEPIPGTEGGRQPFFSPDGRWIGFWSQGKLSKILAEGGIPVRLADMPELPAGAFWTDDGRIILGAFRQGLQWLSEDGGAFHPLTTIDPARETRHLLPWVLPGDDSVLFTAMPHAWGVRARVEVMTLSTGKRKLILENAADARFLPTGHLVFLRQGQLMAAPFDPTLLEVTGPSVPVQDHLQQALNLGYDSANSASGQFWASDSGMLVFASGGIYRDVPDDLVWVDRQGKVERVAGFDRPLVGQAALSPDGRSIAFVEQAISGALWVFDRERTTHTRLLSEGIAAFPVWSPSGKQLAIGWSAAGSLNIWLISVERREEPGRLTEGERDQVPGSWSPDGNSLAIVEAGDILVYDFEKESLKPFIATDAREWSPVFSPDGRWLVYVSDETGQNEVYITSFPDRSQTLMVSNHGGRNPIWSPSGTELFYSDLIDRVPGFLIQVDIGAGEKIAAGVPRHLFDRSQLGLRWWSPGRGFDIDRTDGRFLFSRRESSGPEVEKARPQPITKLNLVVNWFGELNRLCPAGR
ncbi:MAG: protein kinase [Acidobacteriota bacterium]